MTTTGLLAAALHVRDLQERADRADIRGQVGEFLALLPRLAAARADLERLNGLAEAKQRARAGLRHVTTWMVNRRHLAVADARYTLCAVPAVRPGDSFTPRHQQQLTQDEIDALPLCQICSRNTP